MKKENRKRILKCIKESTVELFSVYSLVKLILLSSVLFCGAFILDYTNLISKLINEMPSVILFVIFGSVVVVSLAMLIEWHVFDLFRIISFNTIDAIAIIIVLSTFAYSIVRKCVIGRGVYTVIACIVCVLFCVIVFVRGCVRFSKLNKESQKKSNLIDLRDLLEKRFSRTSNNPILLLEKDVDYDLLDRDSIVYQLYYSIINCQPQQSYVISLEGEWGTGKTTIINNTKRLLDENNALNKGYVYIDDFDPWIYGSQEAILLAMLEALIRHSGMRYSPTKLNDIIYELGETVSNSHWAGGVLKNIFGNTTKNGEGVKKLKQQISHYLRTHNKNIVFIIDNLDRANDENVIFLFKLIGVVFDLPGIIYILSFERERIDVILENSHQFSPRFTEKIIQQEIKVPAISEEKSEILYYTCINNLFEAYGIPKDELQEYIITMRYIVDRTRNIRMFKRMVNSVFPSVFCNSTLLKKSDLFALEIIKFYDSELFYKIYKNSKFFISHDKDMVTAFKLRVNRKSFNAEGASFFETLFLEHEDASELLRSLFPYVDRYLNKTDLESEYQYNHPDAIQISKQSRICSSKYFDLYFSHSSNKSIKIRERIESLVNEISKIKNEKDLESSVDIVKKYIFELKKEDHKEWVEQLQNHITDIKNKGMFYLALSLYALIYYFDDSSIMLSLSAQSRAEYIISVLLGKCSNQEFEEFLAIVKEDYYQLQVINKIHYWMTNEKNGELDTIKTRTELLLKSYHDTCNRVFSENICLFNGAYYYPKNIWGLYHYCVNINDIASFTAYVEKNVSSENIYRVLWDVTEMTISNHYTYSISEENFGKFISNVETVDKIIAERTPNSEDEEFVLQIYEMFRKGEPDYMGRKGVVSLIERKPKL